LSPVELLLDPCSESDTLPLEADPALDADDVLSACAVMARPRAAARMAPRAMLIVFMKNPWSNGLR
jgi:hypothetical protein